MFRRTARRLAEPRVATAVCLAVLLLVMTVAGVALGALSARSSAQLDIARRGNVQSQLVADLMTIEAQRQSVLAAAAGTALVVVTGLAAITAAGRRRRAPEVPLVVEAEAAEGAYDMPALTRDLEIAAAQALATGTSLACVIVEVDHFAAYVQTQGGASGDLLLEEIADIVRQAVRGSDTAYRASETSYVLTLPDTGCESATRLAERLRESIVRALLGEGITVSGGVAAVPSSALDAVDLLAAARAALQDAQRQGRNQVRRASVPSDEINEATGNVGRR